MKIALVVDDLIQNGGQERLFYSISNHYNDAVVYTSCISDYWQDKFKERIVHTSFVQKLSKYPVVYKLGAVLGLYNLAFANFNFDKYDVVISISSRFAHQVRVKPVTKHVVYINSPSRFLWDPHNYFSGSRQILFLSPLLSVLRILDLFAMKKPDLLISNSTNIEKRVSKVYRRYSEVVYPFLSGEVPRGNGNREHYSIITRLVPWKRVEIAISAFNESGKKLLIIGDGEQTYIDKLKNLAQHNIEFLGHVTEARKFEVLASSKAFIMTQREDFGISALEAMGVGTPVVAYGYGGALETVHEGISGSFFYKQTPQDLNTAIAALDSMVLDHDVIKKSVYPFSEKAFMSKLDLLLSKLSL